VRQIHFFSVLARKIPSPLYRPFHSLTQAMPPLGPLPSGEAGKAAADAKLFIGCVPV